METKTIREILRKFKNYATHLHTKQGESYIEMNEENLKIEKDKILIFKKEENRCNRKGLITLKVTEIPFEDIRDISVERIDLD